MGKKIVNFYNVAPNELKAGDVLVSTITLHIDRIEDGVPIYRMYRCAYPPQESNGIPQGMRMKMGQGIASAVTLSIFPVVEHAGGVEDY